MFGMETIEYRTATRTRFGAMLGIIEYSTPTVMGLFDALLSTPFPWILTQSFAFLKKAGAQGAAATPIQPHAERSRLCREPGRGTP